MYQAPLISLILGLFIHISYVQITWTEAIWDYSKLDLIIVLKHSHLCPNMIGMFEPLPSRIYSVFSFFFKLVSFENFGHQGAGVVCLHQTLLIVVTRKTRYLSKCMKVEHNKRDVNKSIVNI